jgi:hypothetical protein
VVGSAFLALFSCVLVWNYWSSVVSSRPGSSVFSSVSGDLARFAVSPHPPLQSEGYWGPVSSPAPVLLSIEPLGTTADSDSDPPVVFPGYLLPDDNHEEPAHEGS